MALLADYVVAAFSLPVPSKKICILWHYFSWEDTMQKTDPTWKQRDERITTALGGCFNLPPSDDQGPPFFRPQSYLIAALVEANKPDDETMAIISAIEQFIETLEFHKQRACEDERVRRRGREWLKTIGRRARQSLPPRKSLPENPHGSETIG
ncbi:uncharacterized protein N7518_002087 [Penicillium psychrosexuale]|uniref:uncharacterized protein n=1 Tax=Penicillium psychrosexuale TaxID=1002107 RepID=UPI0025457314|nr:uncharacterized protein N7518_002087 [Penicillium psychrosexuale]KAJ5800019.1 hypothetical protein N7518_002087 [Penicillium psychrosexuale]